MKIENKVGSYLSHSASVYDTRDPFAGPLKQFEQLIEVGEMQQKERETELERVLLHN